LTISVTAFLFCLGFSVFLGGIFAWVYNYRNLHKEPRGNPQKVTDTIDIPFELDTDKNKEGTAIKRLELEKTSYETIVASKDIYIKKLLEVFRSHLEKEERNILSICYWAFNGEGFALRLANSRCRISENLFIPKNNKIFAKKIFKRNEIDEIPIDIYPTEEQIANSMAGAIVSGEGKLHGYITVDSANPDTFDEEVCTELLELATLTEEALRTIDKNFKLDKENALLNEIVKGIANLSNSSSKGNLITSLSKILQDNFKFDRLMLLTPHEQNRNEWQIVEAVGQQKKDFKGGSFSVHTRCLLYELLTGAVAVLNEKNIFRDPYQRRFYENEPENLELRSLFAVRPPMQNNSYPLIIVIESKNDVAVSAIDEIMLTSIVSYAALKLSDIQNRDASKLERENALAEVDSNGLGDILSYYKSEMDNLKITEESLGILFLKCSPTKKENKAMVFENFLAKLTDLKNAWNVQHLAMLGSGEFVLSIKGDLKESVFEAIAKRIQDSMKNQFDEDFLSIKSHPIWLNKNKMAEIEKKCGQSAETMFLISIANKFQSMTEAN
jgi:transcriptional regulator with GAF, ATPase, and Fis domain